MRPSLLPFFALLPFSLAACGGRSNIDLSGSAASAPGNDGAGGAGGAGAGAGGATAGSGAGPGSSSGTGGHDFCNTLVLVDPVVVVETPGIARAPEIGLLPPMNDVFLSFVEAPPQTPGVLRSGRMDPFTVWPPELTAMVTLDVDVLDYVTGPGPDGPVALIRHGAGGPPFLATTFLPQIDGTPIGIGNGDVLFATAIPDRYLIAQGNQSPDYDVLDVGSYQPNGLPQSEDPLICTTTRVLGAVIPSGLGFIATFTEADSFDPSCSLEPPLPGTAVVLMRYESPAAPGSFLERTESGRLGVIGDPIVNLALAPAPFGGWVIFQSAGINARSAPPIVAVAIDSNGAIIKSDDPIVQLSHGGNVSPQLAATAIGDALAVAWVDAIDPSSPTIVIQLVQPDGQLGASASIATHEAWLSGRIRLLPSADGKSLVVAWEAEFDQPRIGLARLDCLTGL